MVEQRFICVLIHFIVGCVDTCNKIYLWKIPTKDVFQRAIIWF
jgi:hypothetical protein